jgi:hypothetical protein
LSGGDSLTQKIGAAIGQSGFLCVALSDHAIASKWVKKEIAAGLLQSKERAGFTIVPLRIVNIEIPEPLRDYLYIDFTKSFDEGLRRLLNLIQRKRPNNGGFADDAESYFVFWSTEGGYVGGRYDLLLEVVSVDREERFCIVTRIHIRGNDNATKESFQTRGINSPKAYLLQALADEFTEQPARVSLQSAKPANASFRIKSGDG